MQTASISDGDSVLEAIFFFWFCIWPMQLVPEYCCAQGEVGDSHVIFSVYAYVFMCMGAADIPKIPR